MVFVLRGGSRKESEDSDTRVRRSVGSGRFALELEFSGVVVEGEGYEI